MSSNQIVNDYGNLLDEIFGRKDAEVALDGFEKNLGWLVNGDDWEKTIGECDR